MEMLKIKEDFRNWMLKNTSLSSVTPDKYILYLNGLFVLLYEQDVIPFSNTWEVFSKIEFISSEKSTFLSIISMIHKGIEKAENKGLVVSNSLKDAKTALNKFSTFIKASL